LAHVKQPKTAENQVQNYGSKPKVQNLWPLLVFAPRKTPNHFNATPLRWRFPKIQPSVRAKIGKLEFGKTHCRTVACSKSYGTFPPFV
jgi:hypothetical protein